MPNTKIKAENVMKRATSGDKLWINRVVAMCAERGLQLTPLRRQVLEMFASADAPLGAYAVLDELSKLQGKAVGPPTAYRAVEFLVENGFVFRIASRNAFMRCDHLGHHQHGAMLICSRCGHTSEIESPELDTVILSLTAAALFSPQHRTIEISGLCRACSPAT